ncbi:MAG: cation:dicarboxylase symporter family transporter [Sphaerochaetaceae bacterium]|jgi:Na+/H+-dicarboxylate symporter
MKTWVNYLAATFMALVATLLVGKSQLFATVMTNVTVVYAQVGLCILFLLILCGFPSGIASIRKDGKLKTTFWTSVLWAVVTTVVVAFSAFVVFTLFPAKFPATSTTGSDSSFLSSYPFGAFLSNSVTFGLPMGLLSSLDTILLPLLLVCFILGYFLKPNVEVIRPAYVVMNSFSEVMFRLSRAFTTTSWILVFFASASFFSRIWNEGSLFVAAKFLWMLVIGCVVVILLVLPLLFAVFTKFKVNPYQMIYRSIASLAIGLFSGDILLSIVIGEPLSRHNLGCQKRVSATSVPFYSIIGRGGSAMVGAISTMALLYSATGKIPDTKAILLISLAAAAASFCSSISFGSETFLVTVLVVRMLGINLYGAEVTLIAFLPLLNGMGVMIDNLIANMGTAYTCQHLGVRITNPYKNIL